MAINENKLRRAFELVEKKGDWKGEILAVVTQEQMDGAAVKPETIMAAVQHFTGRPRASSG